MPDQLDQLAQLRQQYAPFQRTQGMQFQGFAPPQHAPLQGAPTGGQGGGGQPQGGGGGGGGQQGGNPLQGMVPLIQQLMANKGRPGQPAGQAVQPATVGPNGVQSPPMTPLTPGQPVPAGALPTTGGVVGPQRTWQPPIQSGIGQGTPAGMVDQSVPVQPMQQPMAMPPPAAGMPCGMAAAAMPDMSSIFNLRRAMGL